MAADLNYLSGEHPLPSERTAAPDKMFGDLANGSVAVCSGYPGQKFPREPGASTDPRSKVHSTAFSRSGRRDAAEGESSV
jgi:hypothetical protein